ncbi:lysine-rich arabinogalactan protein 17-like [Pteropus medius]|uniref:lysine-rich arabinogalactan protein 17-like n=1 Tax=Pteropus vampyrus TaxID=132908 RepID=UPI00196B642C|nr:lysine-rich arabinogalactan protein 17-like [Pteropus giganteus]
MTEGRTWNSYARSRWLSWDWKKVPDSHRVPGKGLGTRRAITEASPLPSACSDLSQGPKLYSSGLSLCPLPLSPALVPSPCQDALPATPFPCPLTGQVLPPSAPALPWALLPALLGSRGSKDGTRGVAHGQVPTETPPSLTGATDCEEAPQLDLVQGHTSRRPSPPPPRPSACLPRTRAGSPGPAPRPSSRESRKPGGERPGPGGVAAAVQAEQGPWRFSQ